MKKYDDIIKGWDDFKEDLKIFGELDLLEGRVTMTVDDVVYKRGYTEELGKTTVSRISYLVLYYKKNKIGSIRINPKEEEIFISRDGNFFVIRNMKEWNIK